jgi:hypothetical protein
MVWVVPLVLSSVTVTNVCCAGLVIFYTAYSRIPEYKQHPVFGDFLNRKKLVHGHNPLLSFNRPFAHMVNDLIILDVTNVLKSDTMPGAIESYQYSEVGFSQQACKVSSETSLRLSC